MVNAPNPDTRLVDGAQLDVQIRNATLEDFDRLIPIVTTANEATDWVSRLTIHANLFADVALGVIRWPRWLGRPNSQTLSEGFLFKAQYWMEEHVHSPETGDRVIASWWNPSPVFSGPIVSDGVGDDDHYQVVYRYYASAGKANQIEVEFAGLPWRRSGLDTPPQRYLSSHGWQFDSNGSFTALPEITVAAKPFG